MVQQSVYQNALSALVETIQNHENDEKIKRESLRMLYSILGSDSNVVFTEEERDVVKKACAEFAGGIYVFVAFAADMRTPRRVVLE